LLKHGCFKHAVLERRLRLLVSQVAAIEGEILLVSQFTLYGRLKKPKPDYSKAMGPDQVLVVQASLRKVPFWPVQPQALCIMQIQDYGFAHVVSATQAHANC
jgi:hypothetical protein